MMKIVFGITGSLASGKSEMLRVLKCLGCETLDADEVVHNLYEAYHSGAFVIKKEFGKNFLDKRGAVNRKKLSAYVFGSKSRLKKLNKIIHPLVTQEVGKWLRQQKKNRVALEAAYFDKKYLGRFISHLIAVSAPKGLILERLRKKGVKHSDFFEWLLGVHTFKDVRKKFGLGSKVKIFKIQNKSSKKELERKVKEIYAKICE